MSDTLRMLRDSVGPGACGLVPYETVRALVDVAEAAQEHYDAWNQDYGSYEEGQRIVRAREALRDALARLPAAKEPPLT